MTLHAQFVAGAVVELENIFDAPRAELVAWINTLETDEFFVEESSFYSGAELTLDEVDWSEVYGLDTMPREVMFEKIAGELTGLSWPCYGEGPAVAEKFRVALAAAAEARGWKMRS